MLLRGAQNELQTLSVFALQCFSACKNASVKCESLWRQKYKLLRSLIMYPLFFLQQNILQCSVQSIFGKCSSRIHLAHSTFPLELYVADIVKPNILTLSSNHGFFLIVRRISAYKRKENYSLGCTLPLKLLKQAMLHDFLFNK